MQDLHSTIYLLRAKALNPPVRRSRSQTEPLAPRAKGSAAPSTLTPVRACQPSGIPESTAQGASLMAACTLLLLNIPFPAPYHPYLPYKKQAPKCLLFFEGKMFFY